MAKSRRSKEYWDKRRRAKAQERHEPQQERRTENQAEDLQGLRLPSGPEEDLMLVEAEDGRLIDVPEDKLDDWSRMQGQEAESQELTEEEQDILETVLAMIYGGAEQKS